MKIIFRFSILLVCAAALVGCSAAMVPYSSDPMTKLEQSKVLLEELDRPLPAEKLIREAIEIYQSQNDTLGLAEGYRKYGIFLRSYTVKKWGAFYIEHGFLDKTATYGQRFDKAIEYLSKSREIFVNAKKYDDMVSNVDLNMALAYEEKGEHELACKALDSSLAFNIKFRSTDPNAIIQGAGKSQSFEDVISEQKKRAKCS